MNFQPTSLHEMRHHPLLVKTTEEAFKNLKDENHVEPPQTLDVGFMLIANWMKFTHQSVGETFMVRMALWAYDNPEQAQKIMDDYSPIQFG